MKKVFVSTPLTAPTREGIENNKSYAARCVWDSLKRGEAPYAPHLFFDHPLLLDDLVPHERELGIAAGTAWGDWSDLIAVYNDNGISNGMRAEIDRWMHRGIPIEYRSINHKKDKNVQDR